LTKKAIPKIRYSLGDERNISSPREKFLVFELK
jgi:hypothetical protein